MNFVEKDLMCKFTQFYFYRKILYILTALNLPECEHKIVEENGVLKIFDPLRRKFVALTPEEWVRQNFVSYLKNQKGYPVGLMANEVSLSLNRTARRSDTVIYDCHASPLAIIEYKAPTVKITQKTFDQIVRYNMVFRAPIIVVTNGLTHYCCYIDFETRNYRFLPEMPSYRQLKEL